MRILLGSVDSPSAEPTITDASKANMARFTEPRLYQFFIVVWSAKRAGFYRVKYWEIIADNLSKTGWSWGYVSAANSQGRTIWIADAHRDDEKRFVVRADEKLTAFLELESTIRAAERPEDCGGREIKLDKLSRIK
jgi:hypothetical protein